MKALLLATIGLLFISVAASFVLRAGFRRSLKREAPGLHEEMWDASRRTPRVRVRMILPFVAMMLLGRYRTALAPYPVSRAWASWMFANNWFQVALFAVLVMVTLGK